MSRQTPSFDDLINGIFRPVIGFFVGIALAFTFQLAQNAGWIFAVGWAAFIALLFGAVILLDRFLGWGFDKLTGWGLKPAKPSATKAHWFVRFGWIAGVLSGFGAAYFLPEQMKAWL